MFRMTTHESVNALLADEYANWSPAGARAIVEYFEELAADLMCDLELLDPVSIRCHYTEYPSLAEWAAEHSDSIADHLDDGDEVLRDYVRDNTTLIEFDGGVIVGEF